MYDSSHINRFVKCKRQIWKMMTKKMSLLLTGMLLCLAPDIKGNETDGRIKGIVMDGELGGPLEFVTVQVKAKGSDKILQGAKHKSIPVKSKLIFFVIIFQICLLHFTKRFI